MERRETALYTRRAGTLAALALITLSSLISPSALAAEKFSQLLGAENRQALTAWVAENPDKLQQVAESGRTPMTLAASLGDLEAARILRDAGAALDQPDETGELPLQLSILAGQPEFTNWLLEQGVDPGRSNAKGGAALHWCAAAGDETMCQRFLDAGLSPLQQDIRGLTPLETAIGQGRWSLLDRLIDATPVPGSNPLSQIDYDDDRLRYWSSLFWAGRSEELAASIEGDLLSGASHPLAAFIWTASNRWAERLERRWEDTPEPLREALGLTPRVLMAIDSDPVSALEQFPADSAFELADLFALVHLAIIARDRADYDAFLDYLSVATRLAPDQWQLAWMFENMSALNQPGVRARLNAFIKEPEVAGGQVARYLAELLPQHSWGNEDRLLFLEDYLAAYPQDSRALMARSSSLSGNAYYDEALDWQVQGIVRFPFYANRSFGIRLLMINDQRERARRLSEGVAYWYGNDGQPPRSRRYYIEGLIAEGDRGTARAELAQALQDHPQVGRLWMQKAGLELDDKRPDEALAAALKGWPLIDSPDSVHLEYLTRAYRDSGDRFGAVTAFNRYRESVDHISADLFEAILGDLKALNDAGVYEALLGEALQQQPQSLALHLRRVEELWESDKQQQALQQAGALLNAFPDNGSLLGKVYNYKEALEGKAQADEFIGLRLAQQPWSSAAWQQALDAGLKQAPSVWEEAASAAPQETFACTKLVAFHVDARNWQQAYDWVARCLEQQAASTLPVTRSARNTLLLYQAWIFEQQSGQQNLSLETTNAAESTFEEYRQAYGGKTNYLRYREAFCLARQDKACAAKALVSRSAYQRDNTGIFHDLVARYSGELGRNETFGYGARMLARNPYDSQIVDSYLHKQLLWGGSPIVAIKAIKDANARGLNVNKKWERQALGKLGDSLSEFERYSLGSERPGESLRYIGWFDSARQKALTADGTQVFYRLDEGIPSVEIVLPNGEQVIRRDHLVFGKPLYFARGASFIELAYTETGQLQSMADSSGRAIELTYDSEDLIATLSSDSGVLEFTYNKAGKPVRIAERGMGELRVSYDPAGEIIGVDSDQGQEMALRITRTFQHLLGMVNQVKRIHDLDHLPTLPVKDDRLKSLRAAYQQTPSASPEEQQASFNLAAHLVEHLGDSAEYFDEAEEMLLSVIDYARFEDGAAPALDLAAESVGLLHEMYRKSRPRGLPEETFATWSGIYSWLRSAALDRSSAALNEALADVESQPLKLLNEAHNIQASDFANSAYWQRHGDDELFGKALAGVEKQDILLRANGDLVLATSQGLLVQREGYWHWYGFDAGQRSFSKTLSMSALDPRSNILALAEGEDGVLWLGSANGLMALPGDYDAELKLWSVAQGLPSSRVNALSADASGVVVGTARGLAELRFSDSEVAAIEAAGAADIRQVQRLSDDALLYRADNQVWLISAAGRVSLGQGESFAYQGDEQRVYQLSRQQIFAHDLSVEQGDWHLAEGEPLLIAGASDLLLSQRIHELSIWNLEQQGQVLVVNTDRAINLFNGSYFEALPLPFAAARGGLSLGPRGSTSDATGLALYSEEGVYTRLNKDSFRDEQGPVYDLLVSDKLNGAFMAMGHHIAFLDNDEAADESLYFYSANASHLVEDAEGNLITHDGSQILRFPPGSDQPQELFSARPSVDEEGWSGKIEDMLVDSQGTLWVVSGSSLFRYRKEQVEEFNYLLDPVRFPSRSPMLARVYETLDGGIEVVASDEGHLLHDGMRLKGGLLRWNGSGFDNLGQPAHWFATGYTPLDDKTAVVTTNRGFVREQASSDAWQRRQSFAELEDPSFKAMSAKSSMLWTGGRGARFSDENTWLFPTAGGVVLYHAGSWLYPDRLNQLLPQDQALGQYGGRTVHAVDVAANGRVYVGTDLGLLVYDSQGVASLLNDNQFGQLAFQGPEAQQQLALGDIFLSSLPADTEKGQLLQRYREMQQQIAKLEQKIETGNELQPGSSAAPSTESASGPEHTAQQTERPASVGAAEAEKLRRQLESKTRSREKLLARLETDHLGLYQMLKLDPREVAAMHRRLDERQVLIQYLPTAEKLLIQLVTREGAQIREVNVSRADLELTAGLVVRGLRYRATHLGSETGRGLSAPEDTPSAVVEGLDDKLAWLYDKLLRPVERELVGRDQVLITPVGALTYLPFPALLRQQQPQREYAAERFNLGVIPSMYHLNLVLQQNASFSEGMTLVADPDGSLPGARTEVSRIAEQALFAPSVLEGPEATFNNLSDAVSDARIVHLATHGKLDPAAPEDSYLLLADSYRLNVIDIATLNLDETDLVVLSACETGIGQPGMEYATLARAFALASVPTVVASYWKVDDGATAELMQRFYANLREAPESDFLSAMSSAQRALIAEGGHYAEPAAWAAFTLFGKP
ncbi:CHAT domain-containing protein [Marinobacterium mangrovicola]|uniref:YD repeat-containing protein n=1 Tax=Marinobacterium mangrovicola TaxID=1476959 RepID=A0A4R1GJ24_9GAMM|nr:CHAT domain-containing protein [Marinobacterium mangrovicola]TCK08357.1 YD repeat-containing protein [Marinobacterium mangrovicola]